MCKTIIWRTTHVTIKPEDVKTDESEILPEDDTEVVTVVDGESSRRFQPPAKKH